MAEPEDLSHIEITPEQFYDAVEAQEKRLMEAMDTPAFRAMFGDELADGVKKLTQESLDKLAEARATPPAPNHDR